MVEIFMKISKLSKKICDIYNIIHEVILIRKRSRIVEVKFSLQDRIKHLYRIKFSVYYNLFNSSRFRKMSSVTVAKTDTLHKKSLERPIMRGSDNGNMLLYYNRKISNSKFNTHNRNNIKSHSHDSYVSFSQKAYEPPVYMMEDEEEWNDD